MKNRRMIAIGSALFALSILSVLLTLHRRDPVFEGRRFSDWVSAGSERVPRCQFSQTSSVTSPTIFGNERRPQHQESEGKPTRESRNKFGEARTQGDMPTRKLGAPEPFAARRMATRARSIMRAFSRMEQDKYRPTH